MSNDSVDFTSTIDMDGKNIKMPKPSSIAIVRQFARIYMKWENNPFVGFIAN